jgi:hypothetical protein
MTGVAKMVMFVLHQGAEQWRLLIKPSDLNLASFGLAFIT